jgi:chromosomal replication initiator protein
MTSSNNPWDYKPFWDEILNQFSKELSKQEYSMWFNIEYDSANENTIFIRVPSSFYRDQLIKLYQKAIEDKLAELSGKKITIEFIIVKTEIKISQEKPVQAESAELPPKQKERHPQLNPQYSFDNYVVGENNRMAANGALGVSKNPGSIYNPFLIFGDVGLGKTHLMHAIGNQAWLLNPKLKIICISAEEFTNDFINSIRDKTASSSFKNRYRKVDMLLLDDIHFFQNKEGSQEEMFHTFNALYESKKQLIFTCDRPVSELKNLSERLRSRFERGLNVDLQPPNYETRYAILKKKAESNNLEIPYEVFDFVAKNISTNIRDLESALTKLTAYANLVGKQITLEIAQAQLRDIFSQSRHANVSIDHILKTIAENFNISPNDLKGKKRTSSIVFPRQLAMYIAREITEYSTTELGIEFGGRDHSTVMYACQKIEEKLKLDAGLNSRIQKLIQNIRQMSIKT